MKQETKQDIVKTRSQLMAQYAWEKTNRALESKKENFVQLAKGAPALVMANGLMQALAYWEARGKEGGKELVAILAGWLLRTSRSMDGGFKELMQNLHEASSTEFASKTREALEQLRWVKQFASALEKKERQGE
jgi:CRISPR-associated protein Cmr5